MNAQRQHCVLGTDEFLKKMRDPAFYRIDRHRGMIGNTIYHVRTAPEDVPGLIEGEVSKVLRLLGLADELGLRPLWTVLIAGFVAVVAAVAILFISYMFATFR